MASRSERELQRRINDALYFSGSVVRFACSRDFANSTRNRRALTYWVREVRRQAEKCEAVLSDEADLTVRKGPSKSRRSDAR